MDDPNAICFMIGEAISVSILFPAGSSNYINSIPIPSSGGEPGPAPALAERNLTSKR
jgi:hypothetical protein